ncbi:sulfotransferase [Psychroserpens sp.]|uniref:sulfotransferase family protein n=1 Tax=Psychroserpens sp. TaxID=2020870 RepID=UPI001B1FEF9D|nr:sulfotransferase [Psychroserpens sp.]MBO6605849.1 sulfotransferase [Psychroserpens sp.]MBO6630910.1 sulfotransferase [Psychroserpens sp.]MBO6652780.1 sulfotransferase [Psychroserpens sp.]MBO6681448.1 sulfotransferase [Psychroserpens sp.]MBO6749223.1 sulfotransferase [Psychroserpens sp.]
MKVNFLIIGAAKSATTSLSEILSRHPDICFSHLKEPQFFSQPDWRNNLKKYHSNFKRKAKLYGEGSTNYTKRPLFNPNICEDIYEYNADIKLIYIMRHPIDRIISQFIHLYNRGYETSKDLDALVKSNSNYIDTTRYFHQIDPYISKFGRNNVLLLFFEDFISYPQKTTDIVCNFLNIDKVKIDSKVINQNKSFDRRVLHYKYDDPKTFWTKLKKLGLIAKNYFNKEFLDDKPIISIDTRSYILNELVDEIKAIEGLTGKNLDHWKI